MVLFSKGNLFYKDYSWSNYAKNDPRISGKPDQTFFDRKEGHEMIYLINDLMALWSFKFVNTGHKIEKLIHDKLPPECHKQEEVKQWLEQNLKF